MTSREVVQQHRAAGYHFEAAGVRSFVREAGRGDPVVCVHGVPTSSFLWRKVIAELALRNLRGIAFDLPGLGLAERPPDYDYSWSGLGRFCVAAIDALALDRFHLVVHDIGGPIGFELAAALPTRVRSLTILNTMIEVDRFKRPWSMEPFAHRGLGELWLAGLTKPFFRQLMYMQGLKIRGATPREELDAYVDLLHTGDGGKAFLKIMRGFERTAAKRKLYVRTVREASYPIQIVWGADDPALTLAHHGEQVRRAVDTDEMYTVEAKHFPQEDQAPALADRIASIAERG